VTEFDQFPRRYQYYFNGYTIIHKQSVSINSVGLSVPGQIDDSRSVSPTRDSLSLNMNLIAAVSIACLIQVSLQEAVPFVRDKRQIDSQCLTTYSLLNSREKQCISNIYRDANNPSDPSSFDQQLESLCSDDVCKNAAKKVLVGCRVCMSRVMHSCLCHVSQGPTVNFCVAHLDLYSILHFFI